MPLEILNQNKMACGITLEEPEPQDWAWGRSYAMRDTLGNKDMKAFAYTQVDKSRM